ncbi:MAG: hypothetical protein AAF447_10690, partial [Myxococcota bacterium]
MSRQATHFALVLAMFTGLACEDEPMQVAGGRTMRPPAQAAPPPAPEADGEAEGESGEGDATSYADETFVELDTRNRDPF